MTAAPDRRAEWWTTSDVAAYLGVKVGTVSAYRVRGQMPAPARALGRTQLWRPVEIMAWRGGPGKRAEAHLRTRGGGNESRWAVHGERTIYDNEWVRLGLVDVELPGGERFEHHVVHLRPAAITAVVDDREEAGWHVLMLWRHRFVADAWNWELPGGLVADGEEPAAAAAREVLEETGYEVGALDHVVTYEPIIGMVDCPHYVFVGRAPRKVAEPTERNELERMEWVPLSRAAGFVREGLVRNSGTLIALLHVLARPSR
ncbi:MAG: NUDIX domain-containing protein [Actinomycetales bacterium]